MTSTIGAVARTVIVFAVLFGNSAGCAAVGMRMTVLMICEISVGSACER